MNRRDFIKFASLSPLVGMTPEVLFAKAQQSLANTRSKIVVLLELRGGNDALNTLIPYGDSHYYKLRPSLAIKENALIKLNDGNDMGMHPSLRPLQTYWQNGQLAWIQGLGYPQPNRSHFRSREIWTTASIKKQREKLGWVSQVFTGSKNTNGVSISEALGPLEGKGTRNLRIGSPEDFLNRSKRMHIVNINTNNDALEHILSTEREVIESANELAKRIAKTPSFDTRFTNHALGKKLASVSRLIVSGINIPAYKIGLDGFDTHAKQQGKHQGLLKILAENLDSFAKAMIHFDKWQDVILLTYSEFGRKAKENSSQGTDHGLAAAHIIMGGNIQGGEIYGKTPSLMDLDGGSIKYTEDFRSVYNTLAQRWWHKPSPWHYPLMSFV